MHWICFHHQGKAGFGLSSGEQIAVHTGDLFTDPRPSGETLRLADVQVDLPCRPSKLIALWNNFRALAALASFEIPEVPLYFLKGANSFCAHGAAITPPRSESGRVIYEGELGVVIGKAGKDIPLARAREHIFGYTCLNDVTALGLLDSVPAFVQWTRAKSFDNFTPFGPVISTALDFENAHVHTRIDGEERQNYPLSDMIFAPEQLVSRISQDVTLQPGDVIACGTSVGIGSLRAGMTVEVTIDGIGTLSNRYGADSPR
jgi:2-keto-4-pentenoate hydratase/2-oxohepta-3-ene-1,7-dioic acid hydratase in catechol pathway